MTKVILMCGLPGAGKSTYIKQHISGDAIVISRDKIRFSMVKENEDYFSKEKEVFKEFIREIKEAMLLKPNEIYIDATHLNIASRAKVMKEIGGKEGYKYIVCLINTNINKCIDNNAKRKGRAYVPENVIYNMASKAQTPKFEEGFEEIWFVYLEEKIIKRKGE